MRPRDHLPAWSIERLAFEPGAASPEASAHRDTCDRCRTAVEQLAREREAFLWHRPVAPFVARAIQHSPAERGASGASWWSARHWILGAGAVATAVFVLVAGRWLTPASEVSFKGGGTQLTIFVSRRGEPARPLERGDSLHTGDVIRFGVVAPTAGHAFVASIDERERFTRYFPPEEAASAPVDGREHVQILRGSVELDDSVGREWIVLVLSPGAIGEERVAEALRSALRARTDEALGPVPLDADVRVVSVRKVRP